MQNEVLRHTDCFFNGMKDKVKTRIDTSRVSFEWAEHQHLMYDTHHASYDQSSQL